MVRERIRFTLSPRLRFRVFIYLRNLRFICEDTKSAGLLHPYTEVSLRILM